MVNSIQLECHEKWRYFDLRHIRWPPSCHQLSHAQGVDNHWRHLVLFTNCQPAIWWPINHSTSTWSTILLYYLPWETPRLPQTGEPQFIAFGRISLCIVVTSLHNTCLFHSIHMIILSWPPMLSQSVSSKLTFKEWPALMNIQFNALLDNHYPNMFFFFIGLRTLKMIACC